MTRDIREDIKTDIVMTQAMGVLSYRSEQLKIDIRKLGEAFAGLANAVKAANNKEKN